MSDAETRVYEFSVAICVPICVLATSEEQAIRAIAKKSAHAIVMASELRDGDGEVQSINLTDNRSFPANSNPDDYVHIDGRQD